MIKMKNYIGTKNIKASDPMTKQMYCDYRGWTVPEGEDPDELVRLVEYEKDEESKQNHKDHEGYISMSPKHVFDKAYKIAESHIDRINIEKQNLESLHVKLDNAINNKLIPVGEKHNPYPELRAQSLAMGMYREILLQRQLNIFKGMNFGLAIEALKIGHKIARAGWNGRGMYVVLQEGTLIDPALVRGGAAKCVADAMDDRDLAVLRIKINPHMSIKNVDDSISTWVPSVNDCLAEDWIIL